MNWTETPTHKAVYRLLNSASLNGVLNLDSYASERLDEDDYLYDHLDFRQMVCCLPRDYWQPHRERVMLIWAAQSLWLGGCNETGEEPRLSERSDLDADAFDAIVQAIYSSRGKGEVITISRPDGSTRSF